MIRTERIKILEDYINKYKDIDTSLLNEETLVNLIVADTVLQLLNIKISNKTIVL